MLFHVGVKEKIQEGNFVEKNGIQGYKAIISKLLNVT